MANSEWLIVNCQVKNEDRGRESMRFPMRFGRMKGKEENIEHRTFNVERRSLDGRRMGKFGNRFRNRQK